MNVKIPYLDLSAQIHSIRQEIDTAIARTIDNCSFCLGPDVAQFEKDFARFCGADHCLGLNSGTSALHVALLLLNVGPGDEVITTPFTFVATSWAISYVGAKPVYVDIDDVTMNLDPKLVERAITPFSPFIFTVIRSTWMRFWGFAANTNCRSSKMPARRMAQNTRAKPLEPSVKFPASVFIPEKISARAAKAARW
jgi:hypothetical protein